MTIVAFVPDLMDRSRFPASADVVFVGAADLPTAAADRSASHVIADLGRPGAIEALAAAQKAVPSAASVGFASHVDTELIAAARAAGIAEVLPRRRFFTHYVVELS